MTRHEIGSPLGGSEAMTVAHSTSVRDRRIPRVGLLAILVAAITVAALVYESRSFLFFYDEWDFVLDSRAWGFRSYLQPHSEHWSTIPMLTYKLLLTLFGAGHYQPFMITLLLLHAGTALILFRIVRRRSGDVLGLISLVVLLLLGRGYENILWAFQIAFVGSLFFGLVAIDLLDRPPVSRPRAALASAALVASLMCSGIGLFMCGLVFVDLALDRARRRLLPMVIIAPAVAYAAWDVAFGARQSAIYGPPISVSGLLALRTYVPVGIGSAVAGLFGLSTRWQALSFAGLVLALGLRWTRLAAVDSRILAASAALVAQFSITGMVRYRLGDIQAASPRYIYVASVFLLLILTQSFAGVALTRLREATLAVVALLAVGLGAFHLREAAHIQNELFFRQRAELQTAAMFRHAPDLLPGARIDAGLMPQVTVSKYFAGIDVVGAPVAMVPYDKLSTLPAEWVDNALENLFGTAVRVLPAVPLTDSCRSVVAGDIGVLTDVPAGHGLQLPPRAVDGGLEGIAPRGPAMSYDLYLWDLGQQPVEPATRVKIEPAGGFIRLPDTGRDITWQVRLTVPAGSLAYICPSPG